MSACRVVVGGVERHKRGWCHKGAAKRAARRYNARHGGRRKCAYLAPCGYYHIGTPS